MPALRNAATAPSTHHLRRDPLTHALTHATGLRARTQTLGNALRLTELGARAGLVSHLTGLEKSAANRLYREVHGRPSPPGQTPFTDSWYLSDPRRMLHAAIVWRLYRKLERRGHNRGRVLIAVYETYAAMVGEPLLDVTRAAFVPQLLAMKLWQARECVGCRTLYLTRVFGESALCPGCDHYYRHHCRDCGEALTVRPHGKSQPRCDRCRREGITQGSSAGATRGRSGKRKRICATTMP